MSRLALLLPLLLLAACARWPEAGSGGLAERRPMPVSTEAGLAERLACALSRMDALEAASRQTGRGGGQAALLRLVANRATREVHGSLPGEADRTLVRLGEDAAVLHSALGAPALPECT